MTDTAIEAAKSFDGPPKERIWLLMEQVMSTGLARYDLAIWHWAQSDAEANVVFQRTLKKRFNKTPFCDHQLKRLNTALH